jgi:hypothetical protein
MLDGASDPGRDRSVVFVGAAANLLQELRGKPNRDRRSQPDGTPPWWTLRLLVLRSTVEVMLLLGVHAVVGHRSLRYWAARSGAAS